MLRQGHALQLLRRVEPAFALAEQLAKPVSDDLIWIFDTHLLALGVPEQDQNRSENLINND